MRSPRESRHRRYIGTTARASGAAASHRQLVQLEDRSFLRKERKTSAGVRSITLSPFTATMIAAHIDQRVDTGADALVFANAVGKPLSASSFLTHHFGKAQTAASVSCRFHDPRHASVALATAAGAHPKSIRSRMYGHSSPSSMKRSPRPSVAHSSRRASAGRKSSCR
jgi:hypothetical protein